MTRALTVAVIFAATLAVIVVGFFLFPKASRLHRREALAPERAGSSSRVFVLAGETPDLAVVLKARYSDPERARFTDRVLAEKLGAPAGKWRFVEVWVVNRGPNEVRSLGAPPAAARADGAALSLVPLRQLVPEGGAGRAAAMLVGDLAPDPSQPLRKGAFRRTVYALDGAVAFRDLVSAEVDGVRLALRETTEAALETFLERPRPDLIAALARPEESR
jgi:hypothetical protein